jgi:hypothetical protein
VGSLKYCLKLKRSRRFLGKLVSTNPWAGKSFPGSLGLEYALSRLIALSKFRFVR